MMKFNETEKLLLFAFGCSDRAETYCRLGAVSVAVQCEPFTERCEALRRKLQVHQETEDEYREAFYRMRMELEPYLYARVDVLTDHFREPEEDEAMMLSDYDRVCPLVEMGKSVLLTVCFDEEIQETLARLEILRENMTDLVIMNAADEIYEDLFSLNDNEPWFYPEFMARHSAFAKMLFQLLKRMERHCCGCCRKGCAAQKGAQSCPGDMQCSKSCKGECTCGD